MIQAGTNQFIKTWDLPLQKVGKKPFHIHLDGTIEYIAYKKRRIFASPREVISFMKDFLFSPIP